MIPEIEASRFEQEVRASEVPVLVEFFTVTCAPCHHMLPVLAEIAEERRSALRVFKFNAGEDPAFASQFRISSVPNFLLFKDGQPIGQRSGLTSKRELLAWIDSTLA